MGKCAKFHSHASDGGNAGKVAVLKKFEKNLKNDLTNGKSLLNYNSLRLKSSDADEASDL